MSIKNKKKIIPVVVGPTCSGKSDLGIVLATYFSGEVINLDSVQVYKGLYVATAKVPLEEQQGIPHHLIDIVDPTENFTAGRYAKEASRCILEVENRNAIAVLVGGTGLYLNALKGELFEEIVPTDLMLRERLKKIADYHGPTHLHKMLQRVDPQTALSLAPKDLSRTSRALEVYFQTGKKFSDQKNNKAIAPEFANRFCILVLNPTRHLLYEKINKRVDIMEQNGLLAEIEQLLASGIPQDAKAFNAHGYRRIIEYLQGKRSYISAIEQMKTDTRHYAKRQITWWRREPNAVWFNGFGNDLNIQRSVINYIEKVSS